MALKQASADVVLESAARTATGQSSAVAVPQQTSWALVLTHVSAASGTTPTLAISLEQSDDASSWTAVSGSTTADITAAGNALCSADISKNYVRVKYTIGGTTPSFTFSVAVLVFAD